MKILACIALLCLAGCCEYKHDITLQLELAQKCMSMTMPPGVEVSGQYCGRLAEEGSRIGECK